MGVIELLTVIAALLRVLGVISLPWSVILLPEMISVVLYIDWLLLQAYRWRRERRAQRK